MIFFSYFISAKGLSESLRIFWISQVFPANKDRNTVVEHLLLSPFDARLIRFHPKTYHGYTSMRAEVYGCRKGGCWKFLKLVGSRFRRFSWPKKKLQMYSLLSCCYKLSYERVLKPATSLMIHGILATFCDMSRGQNIPQIGVAQL